MEQVQAQEEEARQLNTSEACTMTDHVAIDVVKEPTLDQDVQTDVDYPVEVVREVHIREDADKINDTDIDVDERGHYKIFDSLANPDEPESIDQLSV